MTNPTPPAAASDAAIAQAVHEMCGKHWDEATHPTLAAIYRRAAEIQSAQPSGVASAPPIAQQGGGEVTVAMADDALFSQADEDTAMLIDFMGMGNTDRLPEARRIVLAALKAALASKADGETK